MYNVMFGSQIEINTATNTITINNGVKKVENAEDGSFQINQFNIMTKDGKLKTNVGTAENPIMQEVATVGDTGDLASLDKINLNVGEETITYDTEDGMAISGNGQITYDTDKVKTIDTEFNIPVVAGDGITIDVDETNKKFIIKATGGVDVDNSTIKKNAQGQIEAVGLTDGETTYTLAQLLALMPTITY